MKDMLVISLGAIFGANARWLISRYLAKIAGPVFPYGTLVINVVGSFIVGFFMIWTTERVLVDPRWRLLIVVGFCGAFTRRMLSGRCRLPVVWTFIAARRRETYVPKRDDRANSPRPAGCPQLGWP